MRFFRASIRVRPVMCVAVLLSMLAACPARGQYDEPRRQQSDDDDDGLGSLMLLGGLFAATSPFWVPLAATQGENSKPGYYAEYPYKHGLPGNMLIGDSPPSEPYTWNFQAQSSYAESFSRFNRIDTNLQLEGTYRIGIDAEFDYWRESFGSGRHRDFWTGNANLTYRFAQSEWLQARFGFGTNWIDTATKNDLGFNFTYEVDLFIGNPLILSAELDWGTLGDETLFHPRVTLGAQWHRAELFIGCDYFDIGPTQATSMIAGARLWY